MTGRIQVPAPRAGVYLLVHPEMWPSNDPGTTHELLETVICTDLDGAYASAVDSASRRAARKVVIDDGTIQDDVDSFGEALLGGVLDITHWERVPASPRDIPARVRAWAATLTPGTPVTVAGFNRYDCVARTVTALQAAGMHVTLDETGTLPCTDASARDLLRRTRAAGRTRMRGTGGARGI